MARKYSGLRVVSGEPVQSVMEYKNEMDDVMCLKNVVFLDE